ncbi:MAG: ABC transporter substrate-binding protein [Caenispirillum bisanense]|nr:ABC transporter substrate-binding protein [Caenispirillum bisanense]
MLLGAIVLGAAVIAVPAQAASTAYPLTLDNCGTTLTFTAAPQRAVSVGQSSTEILYMLGLGDRVAATSVWLGPVAAGYEDINAKIPRLSDNEPSFESIVATKPDLVAVQFQWLIGPNGVVAGPEQFAELGVPVYTSPADCVGKVAEDTIDGIRQDQFSMALIYREIRELAQIFDVQDKGEALVTALQQREAAAQAKAGAGARSALFWFSSAEMNVDPYVAGQKGAPGYIMKSLGLRNVVETDEEWPMVGWETIAKADPDIIAIAKMKRRRFAGDDWEKKMEFLKADPVTREMTAVKEGRIVVLDAQSMNPTIRTIEGLEAVAAALEAHGRAQ